MEPFPAFLLESRVILITSRSLTHFHRLSTITRDSKRTKILLIGASLSEPHIDNDNVPRRGECLYVQRISLDLEHPVTVFRDHAYDHACIKHIGVVTEFAKTRAKMFQVK